MNKYLPSIIFGMSNFWLGLLVVVLLVIGHFGGKNWRDASNYDKSTFVIEGQGKIFRYYSCVRQVKI